MYYNNKYNISIVKYNVMSGITYINYREFDRRD